jgi:hypothetical protein
VAEYVFTVELTVTVDDAGTQETIVFSDKGYPTLSTDTPANYVIKPLLADAGTMRRELFSGSRVTGAVRPAFGSIQLINEGGVLDYLQDYGIAGGRVVVRWGPWGGAYPADFQTVYVAYAESLLVDYDKVRINLKDRIKLLDSPVVTAIFAGTGGKEGTGIATTVKQLCFGEPGAFPPILLDGVKQIYFVQSNAADYRLLTGSLAPYYYAYDNGVRLDHGGYYATFDDLLASGPSEGYFKVWADPGEDVDVGAVYPNSVGDVYFRLESPPAGELRFRSLGFLLNSQSETIRAWKLVDLCNRAGMADVTAAGMAEGSVNQSAGNRLIDDSSTTFADVMDDVSKATQTAYGFTRLDRFFAFQLTDPSEGDDESQFEFTESNIQAGSLSFQPIAGMEAPVWQVSVSAGRTWPMGSLATSVEEETPSLAVEFRRQPWQTTFTGTADSVRVANPGAITTQVEITGNEFVSTASKQAFVNRYLKLYGSRRLFVQLTCTQFDAETLALELHDKVTLRIPRFGCDAGRVFRIVFVDFKSRGGTDGAPVIAFGLWGGDPGPAESVLGGGSTSPSSGGGSGVSPAVGFAEQQIGPITQFGYFTTSDEGEAAQQVGAITQFGSLTEVDAIRMESAGDLVLLEDGTLILME